MKMTKKAFEKIADGLQEAIVVIAMAKSDAEFDGYQWNVLKKAEQSRYMLRSKLALQAAQKAYDLINKVEIE